MKSEKKSFLDLAIEEITSSHLQLLFSVKEGWFFEFKEKCPDTEKLAKSIASFANALGGRLIIGAKENQKSRTLESLPGFSKEVAEGIETLVREAVRHHLRPTPYFECKSIEVLDNEEKPTQIWVTIVDIPQGSNTPYIHSSGVIYQRIGDSSSPSPANDPYTINQLSNRKRNFSNEFQRREAEAIKGKHKEIPRCDLFIKVRHQGRSRPKTPITFKRFTEIAGRASQNTPNRAELFDNFYPMDGSYMARRTEGNLYGTGIIWEYDHWNGMHYFSAPLSTLRFENQLILDPPSLQNKEFEDFQIILENAKSIDHSALVLDLLPFHFFLGCVFRNIKQIASIEEDASPIFVNAKIANIRNCIPFIGTKSYINQIREYGIPHLYRETTHIRDSKDIDDWLKIENSLNQDNPNELDHIAAAICLAAISSSIGISTLTAAASDTNASEGLNEYIELVLELSSSNFRATSHPNQSLHL